MAIHTKKLYYRRGGTTYSIDLYTTIAEVGSEYAVLMDNGAPVYAKISEESDPDSSYLRIRKNGITKSVLSTISTGPLTAIWYKSASGTGNTNEQSVITDTSNNVYIAGSYSSSVDFGGGVTLADPSGIGFFCAKYGADGTPIWAKGPLGTRGTQSDSRVNLVVDSSSNIYVSGWYTNSSAIDLGNGVSLPAASGADGFLVKYNSSGLAQWAVKIGGASSDASLAIATDTGNNIYVTGYLLSSVTLNGVTLSPASDGDIFMAKFSSAGTCLSGKILSSTGATGVDTAQYEAGYNIRVDSSGNIYLCGRYRGPMTVDSITLPYNTASTAFLLKFNSSMVAQWGKYWYSSPNTLAEGLALHSDGSVYVTGWTFGTTAGDMVLAGSGGFVAKYNNSGSLLWARRTSGPYGGNGVAVNSTGSVYVCTYATASTDLGNGVVIPAPASGHGHDGVVIKLNSEGVAQWVKNAPGSNLADIRVDSVGNVLTVGAYYWALNSYGITLPAPAIGNGLLLKIAG